MVAEVVPLKQGLKHRFYDGNSVHFFCVAEVVPLKQGLKLGMEMKEKWK